MCIDGGWRIKGFILSASYFTTIKGYFLDSGIPSRQCKSGQITLKPDMEISFCSHIVFT